VQLRDFDSMILMLQKIHPEVTQQQHLLRCCTLFYMSMASCAAVPHAHAALGALEALLAGRGDAEGRQEVLAAVMESLECRDQAQWFYGPSGDTV
jgi:hypothetical protein